MIFLFTLLLALASIVYELLLGQTLSAFLGNTVLRYSVTIGLYMLAMGIGASLVRGRIRAQPVLFLLLVECGLCLFGGGAVLSLFLFDYLGVPLTAFSLIAHSLILIIGVLTGLEIPLLMELGRLSRQGGSFSVLGIDYIGGFLGTLLFAFHLYPTVGLIESSLYIAILNGVVGLGLALYLKFEPKESKPTALALIGILALLTSTLVLGGVYGDELTEFSLNLYLSNT